MGAIVAKVFTKLGRAKVSAVAVSVGMMSVSAGCSPEAAQDAEASFLEAKNYTKVSRAIALPLADWMPLAQSRDIPLPTALTREEVLYRLKTDEALSALHISLPSASVTDELLRSFVRDVDNRLPGLRARLGLFGEPDDSDVSLFARYKIVYLRSEATCGEIYGEAGMLGQKAARFSTRDGEKCGLPKSEEAFLAAQSCVSGNNFMCANDDGLTEAPAASFKYQEKKSYGFGFITQDCQHCFSQQHIQRWFTRDMPLCARQKKVKYHVTQRFGTISKIVNSKDKSVLEGLHTGDDLTATCGVDSETVYAPCTGTVIYIQTTRDSRAQHMVLECPDVDGSKRGVWIMHLDPNLRPEVGRVSVTVPRIELWQRVYLGQVIGRLAPYHTTGYRPHLHVSVVREDVLNEVKIGNASMLVGNYATTSLTNASRFDWLVNPDGGVKGGLLQSFVTYISERNLPYGTELSAPNREKNGQKSYDITVERLPENP